MFSMIYDSIEIMILLGWLCIAFGVSFAIMYPHFDESVDGWPSGDLTPFLMPFWSIIGFADTNDAVGNKASLSHTQCHHRPVYT